MEHCIICGASLMEPKLLQESLQRREFKLIHKNSKLDRLICGKSNYDAYHFALLNEKIIGVSKIWLNPFHPSSLYFDIEVLGEYRRRGIGSLLYANIYNSSIKRPNIQCSFYENEVSTSFLKFHGFRRFRTTIESAVNINTDIREYAFDETKMSHLNLCLMNLNEVKSLGLEKELVELARDCYTESHRDNPVGEFPVQHWEKLVFEDTALEGSFVVMDANSIIAFALMHDCDNESKDFGWRGVVKEYLNSGTELMSWLTIKQVEYLKEINISWINVEIDDTDEWSTSLLKDMKVKNSDRWISFQKSS